MPIQIGFFSATQTRNIRPSFKKARWRDPLPLNLILALSWCLKNQIRRQEKYSVQWNPLYRILSYQVSQNSNSRADRFRSLKCRCQLLEAKLALRMLNMYPSTRLYNGRMWLQRKKTYPNRLNPIRKRTHSDLIASHAEFFFIDPLRNISQASDFLSLLKHFNSGLQDHRES